MKSLHNYIITTKWTGSNGKGTTDYRSYERSFDVNLHLKNKILGSSDPQFRGDRTKVNPEELFVSSISSCHMLWYLHLCSDKGIVVLEYEDEARGTMSIDSDGSGKFEEVCLNPKIKIQNSDNLKLANQLHHDAHHKCFIANSVNCVIKCDPKIKI